MLSASQALDGPGSNFVSQYEVLKSKIKHKNESWYASLEQYIFKMGQNLKEIKESGVP